MPKRRPQPTDLQIPKHAAAIANEISPALGIASTILIPIIIDIAKNLLPLLMNCGQDKTPAQRLGYNELAGTFSKSATRRAEVETRRAARARGQQWDGATVEIVAHRSLHEAVRPTTDLAACAAECAAV